MKTAPLHVLSILILSSIALNLSSCALPFDEGPPTGHRVPFQESDFAWTLHPGSGSIQGRIGARSGRSMIWGVGSYVDLVPLNAYTEEIINRRFIHHENLVPSGPRYDRFVRTCIADGSGGFSYHNLPAGDYLVGGVVEWQDHETYLDPDTLQDEEAYGPHQRVWAWQRIHLDSGQTRSVIVTQ